MESIANADIFFFITTIAVILLTIFIIVILFYVIRILANFKAISNILRGGAENASKSIKSLNKNLSKNSLIKMFFGKSSRKKKSKKRNK